MQNYSTRIKIKIIIPVIYETGHRHTGYFYIRLCILKNTYHERVTVVGGILGRWDIEDNLIYICSQR